MQSIIIFCLLFILQNVHCTIFNLTPFEEKCVWEDLQRDVVVSGSYKADPSQSMILTVKVTDPLGSTVYERIAQDEANFGFSTFEEGEYKYCFKDQFKPMGAAVRSRDTNPRKVTFSLSEHVQNRDEFNAPVDIAKKENLQPLEQDLIKIKGQVDNIKSEMFYMKRREQAMRDTNESTNARSQWFSIFGMVVLFSVAGWQIFYLKSYFKTKKLI